MSNKPPILPYTNLKKPQVTRFPWMVRTTLLSLLLLAILVALFVPTLSRRGVPPKSRTLATISILMYALEQFQIENHRYPTTAEGLDALAHCPPALKATWHKQIDEISADGWGQPFIYHNKGSSYELRSMGSDGIDGTADDVEVTK